MALRRTRINASFRDMLTLSRGWWMNGKEVMNNRNKSRSSLSVPVCVCVFRYLNGLKQTLDSCQGQVRQMVKSLCQSGWWLKEHHRSGDHNVREKVCEYRREDSQEKNSMEAVGLAFQLRFTQIMRDRGGRLCHQSIQHLLQYLSSDWLMHLLEMCASYCFDFIFNCTNDSNSLHIKKNYLEALQQHPSSQLTRQLSRGPCYSGRSFHSLPERSRFGSKWVHEEEA